MGFDGTAGMFRAGCGQTECGGTGAWVEKGIGGVAEMGFVEGGMTGGKVVLRSSNGGGYGGGNGGDGKKAALMSSEQGKGRRRSRRRARRLHG